MHWSVKHIPPTEKIRRRNTKKTIYFVFSASPSPLFPNGGLLKTIFSSENRISHFNLTSTPRSVKQDIKFAKHNARACIAGLEIYLGVNSKTRVLNNLLMMDYIPSIIKSQRNKIKDKIKNLK